MRLEPRFYQVVSDATARLLKMCDKVLGKGRHCSRVLEQFLCARPVGGSRVGIVLHITGVKSNVIRIL